MTPGIIFSLRLTIILCLLGVGSDQLNGQNKLGGPLAKPGIQLDPGVLIIKYESESQRNWILSAASSANSELYSFKISSERSLFSTRDLVGKFAEIRFDPNQDPRRLAKLLSKYPFIRYAEPRRLYPITTETTSVVTPNDPQFSSQEYLTRLGFPDAWDRVKGEDRDVVVAIVDGGTDWRHEDLVGNLWSNSGEIEGNGLDDDGNGFIDDVRGWNFANNSNDPTGLPSHPINSSHGTETAGVACAVSNNGLGVSGTSWNAKLMPINAGNDAATDGLIKFGYEALLYAARAGADIINLSWGGQGDPLRYEQEIIDMAISEGALVVAAGGNVVGGETSRNNDISYNVPSNYSGVLSVGSTVTASNQLAGHSHFGINVDVYAPGVSVLTTLPGDRYTRSTGTSFASPLVAGLAAMVRVANPGLNPEEIAQQIRLKAVSMESENASNFTGILGAGRISPLASVDDFSESTLRVSNYSYSDSNGDGVLSGGENLRINVELEAMISDITSVDLNLKVYQNLPFAFADAQSISSLQRGSGSSVEFNVQVPSGVVFNGPLRLRLDMDHGSKILSELLLVETMPAQVFNHSNGILALGVTNEGNLGYTDENLTDGIGMAYYSDYILFEGGLLVGDSATRVSDSVRGDDGSRQDEDFVAEDNGVISFLRPGQNAYEETAVRYSDSGSPNPMGLSVLQESFLFNEVDQKNFAILRYTVTNQSQNLIDGARIGLFMDFDLNSRFVDFIELDEAERTGVMKDESGDANIYAGVKLLTEDTDFSFSALSISNDLSSLPDSKKWELLSRGIQQTSLGNEDVAMILSSGSKIIAPGESTEIAFALWVAGSQEEAEEVYATAQELWDRGLLTSSIPTESDLLTPSPNPFIESIGFSYKLAEQGAVKIEIFDALGRKVRSLVDENKGLGSFTTRWDGKTSSGVQAASGVYFVRGILGSQEMVVTRTIHKL